MRAQNPRVGQAGCVFRLESRTSHFDVILPQGSEIPGLATGRPAGNFVKAIPERRPEVVEPPEVSR